MIKIIKCKKEIKYADYLEYQSFSTVDIILFDMTQTEYIPASMIGNLIMLKQKGIYFDLILSSQVEYILRFKQLYNYLTGGSK